MQTVKKGLKSCYIKTGDGEQKLRVSLLAYRTTPSSVTRKTPSELFLDQQIRIRLDVLKPMLSAEVKRRSVMQKNGGILREYEVETKMDGNRFVKVLIAVMLVNKDSYSV